MKGCVATLPVEQLAVFPCMVAHLTAFLSLLIPRNLGQDDCFAPLKGSVLILI